MHELILILSDLTAGVLNIQKVVGAQHKHDYSNFKTFLQTLEVYGTGYKDDVDVRNYKIRDSESHRQSAIKQLKSISKMYAIAILQLENPELIKSAIHTKSNSKVLVEQMKLMF